MFDVGHLAAVKAKLQALLTSEMTPISEMLHENAMQDRTIEDEGFLLPCHKLAELFINLVFILFSELHCRRLGRRDL